MSIEETQPYATYHNDGDGIYTVKAHEAVNPTTGRRDISLTQISGLILIPLLRALSSEGFIIYQAV